MQVNSSDIKLLNKGKVLSDMTFIEELLNPNQKELMLHVMVMNRKAATNEALSLSDAADKTTNLAKTASNGETSESAQPFTPLNAVFWEDLQSFLSTKLDTYTCNTVYNIFKQAYISETKI